MSGYTAFVTVLAVVGTLLVIVGVGDLISKPLTRCAHALERLAAVAEREETQNLADRAAADAYRPDRP